MISFSKQLIVNTVLIGCLACLSTQPAFGAQNNKPLQDSKDAIHFFEEEMRYITVPYAVKRAIDEKEPITIIDVRSAKDYAAGHIPGAINIPYEKYNSFRGKETNFPGLSKDRYNYIYCYELLCHLAKDAAIKFASLGYPVKEMAGGFKAWQDKGLPVEK